MPIPRTETIDRHNDQHDRHPDTPDRSVFIRRRIGALAAIAAVSFFAGLGVQKGREIAHWNKLVGQLERPYDEVKQDEVDGHFKAGEVMTVKVLKSQTAFAEAQDIARDDIPVGDLPAIITAQEQGERVAAGDYLVVPSKMVDLKAVLPDDPNTHVR